MTYFPFIDPTVPIYPPDGGWWQVEAGASPLPWNGDPKNTWTLSYAPPKPRIRVKAGREIVDG